MQCVDEQYDCIKNSMMCVNKTKALTHLVGGVLEEREDKAWLTKQAS